MLATEQMENWKPGAAVASGVGAIAAAIFAACTWSSAEQQTNRNMTIAAVQGRIDACVTLSRHHYEVTNQRNIADVFVNTSRALSLCLIELDYVDDESFKNFQSCVQKVNESDGSRLNNVESSFGDGVAC